MRTAVAAAEHRGAALGFGSVRREAVIANRQGLLGLAERLENADTVNPCGVARARALLTDRSGPLYSSLSGASVKDALWWIGDALRLCPPHRWGCPVIMKIDPEHAAWTCGRCGTIAMSDSREVRPASAPAS